MTETRYLHRSWSQQTSMAGAELLQHAVKHSNNRGTLMTGQQSEEMSLCSAIEETRDKREPLRLRTCTHRPARSKRLTQRGRYSSVRRLLLAFPSSTSRVVVSNALIHLLVLPRQPHKSLKGYVISSIQNNFKRAGRPRCYHALLASLKKLHSQGAP